MHVCHQTVPEENRGEKMQNLHRICTKNALKLRAICTSCTQIELKNPLKIDEKLPESCAQMFCGCDEKFFMVLFKKYSTVTIIQPSSLYN